MGYIALVSGAVEPWEPLGWAAFGFGCISWSKFRQTTCLYCLSYVDSTLGITDKCVEMQMKSECMNDLRYIEDILAPQGISDGLRGTWVVILFGTHLAFSITVGKFVVISRDLDIDLAILIF